MQPTRRRIMERNRHVPALSGTSASPAQGAASTALQATFMRSSGQSQAAQLRGDAVGEAIDTVTLWRARRRARQQLADLSDQMLQDIGISPADVEREYGKPFWRA
jgi:uncharacterized protein YjiS (DUF1127 family)